MLWRRIAPTVALAVLGACQTPSGSAGDPLPSWNEGETKASIVAFVNSVTTPGSADFVPPPERVAVFDNDGTLWSEQPLYFQLQFALDRARELAPTHPEWKTDPVFQAALANDLSGLVATGKKGLLQLVMATHAGMTTDEFEVIVRQWLETARHPRFHRPYNELVYQPMLELLEYLRSAGFATYIVSGGGIEFMRPWTEEVYGIHPGQVLGSSIVLEYQLRGDEPVLVRQPKINFIDDKAGKPVGIHRHIGRRPIFAGGNSDGDYEMLRWTTAGDGPVVRVDRASRRCRARVGVRPGLAHWSPRACARRSAQPGLGGREHAGRLAGGVSPVASPVPRPRNGSTLGFDTDRIDTDRIDWDRIDSGMGLRAGVLAPATCPLDRFLA